MKSRIRAAIAQRNGALSRGPVTPEGRAKSCLNAFKHGLSSRSPKILCLQNEDTQKLDRLTERWIAKLQPRDEAELEMVHEIVAHRWRLARSWEIETGIIDGEMDAVSRKPQSASIGRDESVRVAAAWKSLSSASPALDVLGRYEFRLRRQFERALRDYLLLRDLPSDDAVELQEGVEPPRLHIAA